MSDSAQYGCKKCGSVIKVEIRNSYDRIELSVKDGTTEERSGRFRICCKKCGNGVLEIDLKQL